MSLSIKFAQIRADTNIIFNDLHGTFLEWVQVQSKRVFIFGCHKVPRSLPLEKFRAPHLDARRTLRTPTRRALHFFPCARLCATFSASSTPHRTLCPLLCFAPLPSRWTLFLKVRVAVRISIVVVHVGRRLRSLVQLLTLLSGISCRSPTHGAKHLISSGSLLCKEWALFNLAPAHRASR